MCAHRAPGGASKVAGTHSSGDSSTAIDDIEPRAARLPVLAAQRHHRRVFPCPSETAPKNP
jgi:hypothetical protein